MDKLLELWKQVATKTISEADAISEYMKLGYSRERAVMTYSDILNDVTKAELGWE